VHGYRETIGCRAIRYGLFMSYWSSPHTLEVAARKWRALAERRCAHFVELYHSGRWKRYYSEEQLLLRWREAIRVSERWAEIAPSPARSSTMDASASVEAARFPAADRAA
jgi:uncharacterized repeat protein (TIGR03809 family)